MRSPIQVYRDYSRKRHFTRTLLKQLAKLRPGENISLPIHDEPAMTRAVADILKDFPNKYEVMLFGNRFTICRKRNVRAALCVEALQHLEERGLVLSARDVPDIDDEFPDLSIPKPAPPDDAEATAPVFDKLIPGES